jgi:hypothetical protein
MKKMRDDASCNSSHHQEANVLLKKTFHRSKSSSRKKTAESCKTKSANETKKSLKSYLKTDKVQRSVFILQVVVTVNGKHFNITTFTD